MYLLHSTENVNNALQALKMINYVDIKNECKV